MVEERGSGGAWGGSFWARVDAANPFILTLFEGNSSLFKVHAENTVCLNGSRKHFTSTIKLSLHMD